MGLWGDLLSVLKKIIGPFVNSVTPNGNFDIYPPWLAIAESQLGVSEIPGPKHNKTILDYHKETSLKASSDEVPWCSSFVNWVMEKAGVTGTNSARARSWENWGVEIFPPLFGAVVVLSRGRNQALGHVGFFMGYVAGNKRINVLGGNQSNKVSITSFPVSRIVGFRWPAQV